MTAARLVLRAAGTAVLAGMAAMLAGCASLTPLPADGRAAPLAGRLAVHIDGQPERGVSAGFELAGSAEQGRLLLTGPLGVGLATASWSSGRAVLDSAGRQTLFPDLDSLAVAALGEALPMAALFDWLRGRAWAGAPASARSDGIAGFEQLGWQVNLSRFALGALEAFRPAPPAVTVRVRLELPG